LRRSTGHPISRADAQRRAQRIRAFRDELRTLREERANPLTPEQEAALDAHHEALLARLASEYDIDRTDRSVQLSRGMRLASLFGGAALVAAISLLVSRYWGALQLPGQVALLTCFPVAALGGVELSARRERTLYVASLFAIVAFGTAWMAIVFTSRLLDVPFSVLLLWPGILFGVALALSYGFRIVLAASLIALVLAVSGAFFASAGSPWTEVFGRLEPLVISSFVLVALSRQLEPAREGFAVVARLVGLVMGLLALVMLSAFGNLSLLPFSDRVSEGIYQVVAFAAAAAAIAIGMRARLTHVVNTGSAMLGLLLLTRYVAWFWERLPAWAFFFGLAGCAFVALVWLRRLRARMEEA
jgi:hypothetical protein